MLSKSHFLQISLLIIGLLTITSTYLPIPFDNISYLFMILFIINFFYAKKYFEPKGYTLIERLIIVIIILAIFIIGTIVGIIYTARAQPDFKPAGLSPFQEFIYNLGR
jgi:hypothetical protein